MSTIQKVVGKDPIAQKVLKVDPLAREFAMDHGLVAQGQPQAAPQAQAAVAQPGPREPINDGALQRVRAMRERFARPGWSSAMPAPAAASPEVSAAVMPIDPSTQGADLVVDRMQPPQASTTAQPITPAPAVSATPPAVPQAPARQVTSSGSGTSWADRMMRMRNRSSVGGGSAMPAAGTKRIAIGSMPANPAADDVAAYSKAWSAQP